MLYYLECFHLGKAGLQSFNFTFNRFCMKLFKLGNIELVRIDGDILVLIFPAVYTYEKERHVYRTLQVCG